MGPGIPLAPSLPEGPTGPGGPCKPGETAVREELSTTGRLENSWGWLGGRPESTSHSAPVLHISQSRDPNCSLSDQEPEGGLRGCPALSFSL